MLDAWRKRRQWRKKRKLDIALYGAVLVPPHVCNWCGEMIVAGQKVTGNNHEQCDKEKFLEGN